MKRAVNFIAMAVCLSLLLPVCKDEKTLKQVNSGTNNVVDDSLDCLKTKKDTAIIEQYELEEYSIIDKSFFRQLDKIVSLHTKNIFNRKYVFLNFYKDISTENSIWSSYDGSEKLDSFFVLSGYTSFIVEERAFVRSNKYIYVTRDKDALGIVAKRSNKSCVLTSCLDSVLGNRKDELAIMKFTKGKLSYLNPEESEENSWYYMLYTE